MSRIGIEKYNPNYTVHMKELSEAKFIGEINARNYGIGYIYYLLKKGAMNVAEHTDREFEDVNYVKTPPNLQPSSMWHRVMSIGCQIELDKSSENRQSTVEFYVRDIERVGKGTKLLKATRLSVKDYWLEPDAIFLVDNKLFCFEYENQTSTARSFGKILRHCDALRARSAGKHFDIKSGSVWKAHRVLFVFEKEEVMINTIKRCQRELDSVYFDWFLFKSIDEVVPTTTIRNNKFIIENINDYFSNWTNLNLEKVDILA